MRKIIVLALAFIFASTISFAATTTKNKTADMEMTGKVKTVTIANASKGTKSEVIVTDDKSMEKTFLVNSTTTIYDAKFKAIALDKIKVNDKVKVKYITTKEGVCEAASINILT
jgi:hypothetical protein